MRAPDHVERLLGETLIPLDQSRQLPGAPSPRKLYEWRKRGVSVPGRHLPVLLECVKIGRIFHTSKEAYARFIKATNE